MLVAHEDCLSWGYGAEIAARIADELFANLDAPVGRVGALDTWVGYHPQLEAAILPQIETLVAEMTRCWRIERKDGAPRAPPASLSSGMRRLGAVAITFVLCGCQRPQTQKVLAAGPETIACFGDSLTAGFGLPPGASYPDVLQRKLDAAGGRYRVLNLGVSGETTGNGVARLPAVLAEKPDLVVLEFGANDGLRGIPVEIATANLERMIEGVSRRPARAWCWQA